MNFDDPTVKRLAYVLLSIMVLLMMVIAGYCAAISIEYVVLNESKGNNGDGLAKLMAFVPRVQGSKLKEVVGMFAILIAAVPLMFAPVCVKTAKIAGMEQRLLTSFGAGLLYSLLVILPTAVVAYLSIDPAAWNAAQAHSLDLTQLMMLQDMTHNIIRICVFFLAALLGLKAVR